LKVSVSLSLNLIGATDRFHYFIGAGFDNWLDAVDKSFCTFEGGDDPAQVSGQLFPFQRPSSQSSIIIQDGIYPDTLPGGFDGRHFLENMVSRCN
jgi:hypothetical protein